MVDGLASLLWDQHCCLPLLPTAGDPLIDLLPYVK